MIRVRYRSLGALVVLLALLTGCIDDAEQTAHAALPQAGVDNFQRLVLDAERPVVVDFSAEWCPPCQRMAPILAAAAADHAERVATVVVDVDAHGALAARYQVEYLPTLAVFIDGELVQQSTGFHDRQALDALYQAAE